MRARAVAFLMLAGCGVSTCGAKPPGAECAAASECRSGHLCVPSQDMRARCMPPCVAGTFMCEDGSLCIDRGADGMVCWFGGIVPQHFECATTPDCEAGTLCAEVEGTLRCEQACFEGTGLPCRSTETCTAIADPAGAGWCQEIQADGGADAP